MTHSVLGAPVSPLRQRVIDDMNMRRFSRETQRNYLRDIRRLATFLGRSPDTATADDLRRFQIEQQEDGVPVPTMNSIVSALRFFFTHTLDRPELARRLVRSAHSRNLPVVLSRDEVARLLNATTCLKPTEPPGPPARSSSAYSPLPRRSPGFEEQTCDTASTPYTTATKAGRRSTFRLGGPAELDGGCLIGLLPLAASAPWRN